jgi:elongation factor P--beta-lysine ligase
MYEARICNAAVGAAWSKSKNMRMGIPLSPTRQNSLIIFELGMPPHGGLAIGLERLTALILGIGNIREAAKPGMGRI